MSPSKLSVAEVARRRGCHEATVRQAIKSHKLAATQVNGRWEIAPEDVDALWGKEDEIDPIKQAAIRVVSEAPVLSGAMLDEIAALLRGNVKSAA